MIENSGRIEKAAAAMIGTPSSALLARRRAERRGRRAERLAVVLLAMRGCRVLERRWRANSGEIDIIARRGRCLIACEVKARSGGADVLVRTRQWRRIAAALDAYVAHRPELAPCERRFDLVEIVAGRWPRHLRDAWRP